MFEGETRLMDPQSHVLALLTQGEGLEIVFLPAPSFLLALGAGLFIGLVMLVFEYGVPAKPRERAKRALVEVRRQEEQP